jgi:hypothetical protein
MARWGSAGSQRRIAVRDEQTEREATEAAYRNQCAGPSVVCLGPARRSACLSLTDVCGGSRPECGRHWCGEVSGFEGKTAPTGWPPGAPGACRTLQPNQMRWRAFCSERLALGTFERRVSEGQWARPMLKRSILRQCRRKPEQPPPYPLPDRAKKYLVLV